MKYNCFPLKLLVGFAWLAATLTCTAQNLVINEIVASNGSTLADEDGDFSDWIEIINRGLVAVDLTGWGLSDKPEEPFRWVFNDLVLHPNQHLLVWASGKDRAGGGTSEVTPANPDTIGGLVVWLRADALNLQDNEAVASWTDSSGRGNHAEQLNASQQPRYISAQINGLPVVRFNRSQSQFFELPTATFDGMEDLANFTILAVVRWNGATGSGIFGTTGYDINNGSTHFEINSGGQLRLRVSALDGPRVSGTIAQNSWELVGASMHSATDHPVARLYQGGQMISSAQGDPGDSFLNDYHYLRVGNSHTSRPFDGDIAELIIYNRALTPQDRESVENYLKAKYAMSPPMLLELLPHTNFSIAAAGEPLQLTRPDGTIADFVPPTAIPRDVSYGRSPDATGAFAFFAQPTPMAANTTQSYGPPVEPPVFSHGRGYYQQAFYLSVTHPDPEVTLHFSLDGSIPNHGFPQITGPLLIDSTTILRVYAHKPGALPLNRVATQSYLFADDIVNQAGTPAGYPNTWGGFTHVSYGMSPNSIAAPGHADALTDALFELPTLSIVIPVDDMFGSSGVYSNPTVRGLEREASAEWIFHDGRAPIHIGAGLRIQGGASRNFNNTPKKSMRLLFKSEYGAARLREPIFADIGHTMDDFNTLILRAEYNNSWVHWDRNQRLRGLYVRDQWMRDTQLSMSGLSSRGHHVHLFINGIYWGVYNPSERADAAFAANVFGGEREDYDAMTHRGLRDGNRIAWDAMFDIARSGLTDPANYAEIQQYLDLDSFIDYMILNHFGGNHDWPHNNWNAIRHRVPGAGWRFMAWDAERSLEGITDNRSTSTGTGGPGELYNRLRENPEFRLRFADRIHRHYFNGGALTPAAAIERMQSLLARVEGALYGEQARWGSYRHEIYDRNGPSPRYQLDPHWILEKTRLLDSYFPNRSDVSLDQYLALGLYPGLAAPVFSQHGGDLEPAQTVAIAAAQGAIHYTTDGTDPREPGTGVPATSALLYTTPVALEKPATLKARAYHNGTWSALTEATFIPTEAIPEFLPEGTADWTADENWNTGTFPDGVGASARIFGPMSADRAINIRQPVSIGHLYFEQGESSWRNRIRDRSTGNTLTFAADSGNGDALLQVNGTGTGFVEFEFDSACILESNLTLEVNNIEGHPDHGALRLRTIWTGSGGLHKSGPGMASLTGEDKLYLGPTVIEQGVLQVTEPAAMSASSSITVFDGGQLRLNSSGSLASPRVYTFGGPLFINGAGRSGVPESAGMGVLGSLRYEPGTTDSKAIVTNPVVLQSFGSIHVATASNVLELSGGLSGTQGFSKSGGGTLILSGDISNLSGTIAVQTGSLQIAGTSAASIDTSADTVVSGFGSTHSVSGSGTLVLDSTILEVNHLTGTAAVFVFTQSTPDFSSPASSGNGVLISHTVETPLIEVYLDAGSFTEGDRFSGALVLPPNSDWSQILPSVQVFAKDPLGDHFFKHSWWSDIDNVSVTRIPIEIPSASGPREMELLDVRIGGPPLSFTDWQIRSFPNPDHLQNPDWSGPLAAPFGDDIPNLVRYAQGVIGAAVAQPLALIIEASPDSDLIHFPFNPDLHDLQWQLEASEDLYDWSDSAVLFDSTTSLLPSPDSGLLTIPALSTTTAKRFYRLKISFLQN